MKELDRYRLWLFLTVGMGIATFCVANASPGLTLISLPLWLLAWPASYGKNGKPLPRPLILALVLAATANLIAGVLRTPDDIVAVVAEYLVWLHLVKLYDRSEPRDQGQLLTMSLFLALGACLTSNSFALALMLLVYVPMFVWTLMLHQLHSGRRQAEAGLEELRPADRRRIRPDAAIGLRPQSRFAALVAGVLVFSFIGAAIVFVITPRQSMTTFVADWSSPSVGRVSGFNDEVRLGAAGLLSESNTPVFDLRVTNEEGEDIGQQLGQLRLRGAVLDQYSDGQWRKSAEGARLGTRTAAPGQASIVSGEVEGYPRITQMVTFRGRSGGPLFALYRPLEFETDRAREFRTNFRDASIEIEDSGRSTYRIVSQPD
ncbi:MAG: DUF3488 domain-containing protein, partial [Planctomycetota bacterium]|nr:DUF3488 domain-containing protein [Planctomycetota bacterium]